MNRRSLLQGALVAPFLAMAKRAHAGLSVDERASVKHAAQAARSIGHAETQLAQAIRAGGDRALQAKAAAALIRVSRDTGGIVHGLLGGIVKRADGSGITRADQLTEVWAYRNGAMAESLETAGKALRAAGLSDSDVVSAQEHVRAVDATLAYSDPTSQALLFGQTVPAVLGPHGEYEDFQWQLFLATHYWREWAVEWVSVFKLMPSYKPWAFADTFGTYARCVDFQVRAAALVAGVPIGENDTTTARLESFDPVCRLSQAGEWLWVGPNGEGAPQFYKAAMWTWAQIDPLEVVIRNQIGVSRAYRKANERLADSWSHSDQAIGGGFAFRNDPMKTRCAL